MADCPNYNCVDSWAPYVQPDCGESYLGGAAKAVLFKCGQALAADITDSAALGTEVAAMITAGTALLVDDILVQFAAPSVVNGQVYIANTTERPITYDRSVNWVDANVTTETVGFYNSINGSTGQRIGGMLLLEESGLTCIYINEVMTATGGLIFNNAEDQRFEFNFNYRSKTDPIKTVVPDNVF